MVWAGKSLRAGKAAKVFWEECYIYCPETMSSAKGGDDMKNEKLAFVFRPVMNQRGFPLIELYIVMAILVILLIVGGTFVWSVHKAGGFAFYWENLSLIKKVGYGIIPGFFILPPLVGAILTVIEIAGDMFGKKKE